MNNIENIEIFVEHNWADLSDEFKSDWAALAKQRNQDTGAVDEDLLNAFVKKHKTDFMHNQGGEIVDLNAGKPLVERMQADSVDFSDTSSVYDRNLARKYNVADPNTVRETRAKEQARLEKEAADKKRVEEYKKDQEALRNRQKAVNEYQHSYLGMDYSNPLNILLNKAADFVISEDTKKAIANDPNDVANIGVNIGSDITSSAADFLPGWGTLVGPGIRTARAGYNIAANDKPINEAIREQALDIGSGIVFKNGLKGVPGLNDIGWLGKIEEKLPFNEWYNKLLEANPHILKEGWTIPNELIDNPAELAKWVEKLPNGEAKKAYKEALKNTPVSAYMSIDGLPLENSDYLYKQLEKTQNELADKEVTKKMKQETAKEWLGKEWHPTKNKAKAGFGLAVTQLPEAASKASVRKAAASKAPQVSKPDKVQDYASAVEWTKQNYQDQWQAGFVPRRGIQSDIMVDAYEQWFNETH